ncbi:LysR family transcriptional regulator [Corallococcus terminator]|uniref:LysR family transcriptional regulator n=1 Tax=Corallococcus terminator TaxID=2316733 RepID=A0A3A8IDB2_9BACT|nr:LysR family transcriptional regulator [Corallococcus terminator]RKG77834.1 LysR family transcriptional regulator [Corallococcus terminator]
MENKLPAWDDLRVLLEVHRRGSFLAAGHHLGMSTSTVARRIGAIEKDLGCSLVHRTSQGAWLEREALELVGLAEGFEQSLAARRRDRGGGSPYAGVVRVSLPDGFMPAAAEAAARFRRLHPETLIEAVSESRFVDLASREADIGIRGGRSSSPALIDKPLGEIVTGLYASEDYLSRCLPSGFLGARDYGPQDFLIEDGVPHRQSPTQWLLQRGAVRFPFRSNSMEARLEAAKRGMGLVFLAVGAGKDHPRLVRVGLETPFPTFRFYLSMHKELRRTPRIRGVAASIEEVFAEYMAAQAESEALFRPKRIKAR